MASGLEVMGMETAPGMRPVEASSEGSRTSMMRREGEGEVVRVRTSSKV